MLNIENPRKMITPEENYEAASIELAVYRMMQRDYDTVKASMDKDGEEELFNFAEKRLSHMLAFIEKQVPHITMRSHLLRNGWQILQKAAVIILIINICLATAVATSSHIRAKVIQFLTEKNDSYMHIGFSESDEEIIVPKEWKARYYPAYIPEGYFIRHCISNAGVNMAEYSDANGNSIIIQVNDIHSFSRINTENAEIEFIQLHGIESTVIRQPFGDVSIIWALGDCYFEIDADNYETALDIAKSIKIIQAEEKK